MERHVSSVHADMRRERQAVTEKMQNSTDNRLLALSGTVYGIIYKNDSNGYSVIEIDAGDDVYTATGICPSVAEGEQITVYGA